MNTLQQLAKRAGLDDSACPIDSWGISPELEKFAELIINDCIQAAGPDDSYQDEWFRAKADSADKIRKWFNVSQ